jgi:hypothetical protein
VVTSPTSKRPRHFVGSSDRKVMGNLWNISDDVERCSTTAISDRTEPNLSLFTLLIDGPTHLPTPSTLEYPCHYQYHHVFHCCLFTPPYGRRNHQQHQQPTPILSCLLCGIGQAQSTRSGSKGRFGRTKCPCSCRLERTSRQGK